MFYSSVISSLSRGACLLPSHLHDWSLHPGVQGEGEGGAEGAGEVEGLTLASQCLETSSHIVAVDICDYLKIRYSSGRAAEVMLLCNPASQAIAIARALYIICTVFLQQLDWLCTATTWDSYYCMGFLQLLHGLRTANIYEIPTATAQSSYSYCKGFIHLWQRIPTATYMVDLGLPV